MPRTLAEDAGVPYPYVCNGRVCTIIGSDVSAGLRYLIRFPDLSEQLVNERLVLPNWSATND